MKANGALPDTIRPDRDRRQHPDHLPGVGLAALVIAAPQEEG